MRHFLFVIFLTLFLSVNAFADLVEDQLFDSNQQDDISLLFNQYQKSKVLFIGFSFHSNHQHVDQLTELLKKVGDDKNLKYIIFERPHDVSAFHELLSTQKLEQVLAKYSFRNVKAKKEILCRPEFAYTLAKFFPELQKINQKRIKTNPILVKTIDGRVSGRDEYWPGEKTLVDGTCKAKDILMKAEVTTNYGISSNREQDTADNFTSMIWSKLAPQEKAIVIYNRGHLLPDFESCLPTMVSEDKWVANRGKLTWLGRFLENHPKARKKIGLIIIDEKFSEKHDGTTFQLSARQSQRKGEKDWAINLHPFKAVAKEKGMAMFTASADFRVLFNGHHFSQKSLPDLVDGLIWNSRAHLNHRNTEARDYLPLCADPSL